MKTKSVNKERYKLCPHCGNFMSISELDNYCYLCGVKMIDSCPSCNEPIIYPTSVFCPVCGVKLVTLKND